MKVRKKAGKNTVYLLRPGRLREGEKTRMKGWESEERQKEGLEREKKGKQWRGESVKRESAKKLPKSEIFSNLLRGGRRGYNKFLV